MTLCFAGRQPLENSNSFKNTDFGTAVPWPITQEGSPWARRQRERMRAGALRPAPRRLQQGPDGGCKHVAASEPNARAAFAGESAIGATRKSDRGRKTKRFLITTRHASTARRPGREMLVFGFPHFRAAETDPWETDPPETDPLERDPPETDPPEVLTHHTRRGASQPLTFIIVWVGASTADVTLRFPLQVPPLDLARVARVALRAPAPERQRRVQGVRDPVTGQSHTQADSRTPPSGRRLRVHLTPQPPVLWTPGNKSTGALETLGSVISKINYETLQAEWTCRLHGNDGDQLSSNDERSKQWHNTATPQD